MRFRVTGIILILFLSSCHEPLETDIEGVLINEFMARNNTTVTDPAGDYDDWLELYNYTETTIDLSGFYLSDDHGDPNKFQLPVGTEIPAGGFLLIWTDGEPGEGSLHCNFRLSAFGEEIGLYDPDAIPEDEISFDAQMADISMGRYPDGSDSWHFFGACDSCLVSSQPSPGFTNN